MKRRVIPRTDLDASVICMGTSLIGSSISESDSFRLLDQFVDLGGNFIDTALNYADWSSPIKSISEKTIGKWLKQSGRSRGTIIATKGACPEVGGRFYRLTPADLAEDLHRSLTHLQVDCIDLYWLHRDDVTLPVEGIIDFLHEQTVAGKIRYYACSNWTQERLEAAQEYAQRTGKQGFVANQMMWSLAEPNRDAVSDKTMVLMDERLIQYHERTGLAAIPFSSQASGFFSSQYRMQGVLEGKQTGEDMSKDTSKDMNKDNKDISKHMSKDTGEDSAASSEGLQHKPSQIKVYYNETSLGRYWRVQEKAEQLGVSSNALSLACLLSSQSFATYPIIGSRTAEQLVDSCSAGGLELDQDTIGYIVMGESPDSARLA